MRVIIAGSRSITDYNIIINAINNSGFIIDEVVSGGANGVDKLGEKYAKDNNIKLTVFKAKWEEYGKSAGYIRNKVMSNYADGLIAIWDGSSKGTNHMINIASDAEMPVFIHKI